jgi:hypothetical protein
VPLVGIPTGPTVKEEESYTEPTKGSAMDDGARCSRFLSIMLPCSRKEPLPSSPKSDKQRLSRGFVHKL